MALAFAVSKIPASDEPAVKQTEPEPSRESGVPVSVPVTAKEESTDQSIGKSTQAVKAQPANAASVCLLL